MKIEDITTIKCTDIDKVYCLNKPKIKYVSKVNAEADKVLGKWSTVGLMEKFRKIYGWQSYGHKWNHDTLSFEATLVENAHIKEVRTVTYDEICKEMFWHSFTETDGILDVKPFTFEEKEAFFKPMMKKTMEKDIKNEAKKDTSEVLK